MCNSVLARLSCTGLELILVECVTGWTGSTSSVSVCVCKCYVLIGVYLWWVGCGVGLRKFPWGGCMRNFVGQCDDATISSQRWLRRPRRVVIRWTGAVWCVANNDVTFRRWELGRWVFYPLYLPTRVYVAGGLLFNPSAGVERWRCVRCLDQGNSLLSRAVRCPGNST
jgi:hypothetical protein